MTSLRMLPAMDIHQSNDEHDVRYYLSKNRYPTDESNDQFELFICPYMSDHKITSKRWRIHLQKCKENYGGNTLNCVFNASHHIPQPEYEWHTMTCPDRVILQKDFEKTNWVMASSVNHNPDWIEPDTGESWDDEIDEDAEEFVLDVKKGMPLALKPPEEKENDYEEDCDEGGEYNELNGEPQEQVASVRDEDLIPEKPSNWNEMSKTQKKNHKRKYDRQRQRMDEEGVTEEEFVPVKDPMQWSEKQREDKLAAVKANFPMADDKINASRFDYTSLLNIVCQKVRINLPEYQPCGSETGGFAYRCRVHQTWYNGHAFASTKKDAKHECAKWAILGMDIPGIDSEGPVKRGMPIHPKLLNQSAKQREGDEMGRLMEAGMYSPQKKPSTLRQPKLDLGGSSSPQRNSPQGNSPNLNQGDNYMANYVKMHQQQEQQQKKQPNQGERSSMNSMEEYIVQRREEEEEKAGSKLMMQEQQMQYNQQEDRVQEGQRGWNQQFSQPHQNTHQQSRPQQTQMQQTRPKQPQPQQPQPQYRSQQPQKVWGGWGAPQQQPSYPPHNQMAPPPGLGGPPPGMYEVQNSMNAVSLDSGMDFPSLGSDEWKTVPKKSAGVNTARGRGGRGRGRGTTMMKL